MTPELLRLFTEGGGKEVVRRQSVVRRGARPQQSPTPGSAVGHLLSMLEDDAMAWQIAEDLAIAETGSLPGPRFMEVRQRAYDFLRSVGGDKEEAMLLLLEARDRLRERFDVSAWDAYWAILHRAFHQDATPLALARSLVRALEETAA